MNCYNNLLQGIVTSENYRMARKTASDFFDKDASEPVVTENVTEDEKEVEPVKSSVDSEVKDFDSENSEKEGETGPSVNSAVASGEPQAQSQEEYMKQYQQYMQQYQQYYSQYYNQYYTNNSASVPVASDPAYEYFTGTSSATTAPPATSFDASRASRQMSAYFDPTKFQAVLSPEMLAAQRAQKEQQQSKLTAKEIEAFKKKKIEKKKAKNRWLFE